VFNLGLLAALTMPESTFEIGLVCLVVSVIACVKGILNGHQIHLKTLHISSPKITQHYNLVFISDIHLGSNPQQHLENICTKIDGLDYDYLLIGGDLYDSSAFEAEDVMPLTAIQKPILFVTGNHEYYVKDHADKVADLANYNITILDNESVQSGALNIIGISDNQAPKLQSDIAHGLVSQDAFNLLMVHQPSIWDSAPDSTDLMLSGHTHNGQIFPFNLLVRLQFKTVYGIYKRLNSTLYVSSGSGTWGPRMRLGTKNEIVHISISPQNMI
jgi:predicted MPP superfamily phosphohydrolase